ncbi:T9SS type A sorting domain-containing protein [Crocinitomix catalasitica]|nr:T9SS type A sorting domain-containing protein [Crocinitomix catalasitica]
MQIFCVIQYMNTFSIRIIVFLLWLSFTCTTGSCQENWQLFTTANSGIGNDHIEDIIIDEQGFVWVAGYSKLSRYNGLTWKVFNIPAFVHDLELRKNGNLLIATSSGLYEFDTKNLTFSGHLNEDIPGTHIECVSENQKGQVWVGFTVGSEKIAFYDGLNWSAEIPSSPFIGYTVYSIDCFENHTWAGMGASLLHHNGTSWEIYNKSNSPLPGGLVLEVKCDKIGKVWIGTSRGKVTDNYGRLITYDQSGWTVINELDCNAILDGVCSIAPNDSSYWFASYWNGFVHYDMDDYNFYDETNTIIPTDYAISIATDSFENVYLGTTKGLVIYNSDSIQIDAYKYEDLFQCYPNPVSNQLFITFGLQEFQDVSIKFYGANGRIVEHLNYRVDSGRNQIEIDVSNMSRGTYFVHFTYGSKSFTRKIIIM